jgi:hypothetical protein
MDNEDQPIWHNKKKNLQIIKAIDIPSYSDEEA